MREAEGGVHRGPHLLSNLAALTHDFIPPHLLYRDREYARLARRLELVRIGFPPPNFIVLGSSGSGKTVTVRKVLNDLSLQSVYVVCEDTAYGTLVAIHSLLTSKRKWGLSMGVLWSEVDELMPKPCVVVLDEAEKFMVRDDRSDELLYYITSRPETGLILISNRMDLPNHVKDPRVKSRFNPQIIIFPPYEYEELYGIVETRLKLALNAEDLDPYVDGGALKLIASLARKKGGDARYAIDLLREAVGLWIGRGGRLNEDHVREAKEIIETSFVEETLRSLSSSHKLMLLAALNSKTVGEAYKKYNEMADQYLLPPLSERRLRDVLGDLELMGYLFIERIGKDYYVKPSKWLPENTAQILDRELRRE